MDTLTIPQNVAVLLNLEEERSSLLRWIAAVANSFDEEHTALAVEFDFSID